MQATSNALVTLIYLVVGLFIGLGLGFFISNLRSKANGGASKIASDLQNAITQRDQYKSDLDALQNKALEDTKFVTELAAMKETVANLNKQATEANRLRTEAEVRIDTTINEMRRANQSIFDETRKIAGALSSSQTRGKFGEAQLELLLTSAGLRKGHEYESQRSTTDDDNSGIPDITVKVPGGSQLFIDSKFPYERFVDAFDTEVQEERDDLLRQHTKDLMKHVEVLAKRGYHKSQKSPDFVILFLPFETLLSEALRLDPNFLEKAFKLNVTIATPTSMMALLRTVGAIYSRNQLAQNADDIQKVANTFLKNITLLHTKIVAVGKAVNSVSKAYEDLRPTAEKTVLNPARKILNLGVSGDRDKLAIEYPEAPEDVKELKASGAESDDDFIDVEVVEEDK
jgi:DNA recombination protein RmuC